MFPFPKGPLETFGWLLEWWLPMVILIGNALSLTGLRIII